MQFLELSNSFHLFVRILPPRFPANPKLCFCCASCSGENDLEAAQDGLCRSLILIPHGAERQRKVSRQSGSGGPRPQQHCLLYTPLCHVTCWVPPYWNLLEAHQLMHERRYFQVLVSGQPTANHVITYERVSYSFILSYFENFEICVLVFASCSHDLVSWLLIDAVSLVNVNDVLRKA